MTSKRRDREYTDEFRAEAVAILIACGWPDTRGAATRAAAQVGVADRTLVRWASKQSNPPPDNVVTGKTSSLADLFESELHQIFEAMQVKRERASYKDLGIVGGILTDKMQLLRGEPTERHGFTFTADDGAAAQKRVDEWEQSKQLTTSKPSG